MKRRAILIPFSAFLLITLACEDEVLDDVIDPGAAAAQSEVAITALEDEFFAFISAVESDGVDDPSDIDFSASNALFKAALVLDPDNLDANFGAGLTELLIFSQDQEVQEVFDTWEAYLDTGSPFVADTSLGKSIEQWGLQLPNTRSRTPLQILNDKQTAYMYLRLFRMMVSDPPTFDDIQQVIEQFFLPRLDYALERFEIVDDDADYSFIISPKMQGDLAATPVEFDLTELFVLEALVNIIRSFASVAVAYTVGPSAYDSAAVVEFLSQGSGFLSLRSTGATQMGKAKETMLTASHKLDAAVDFLRAETDDQSDDIITIQVGELTEADLTEIKLATADFRTDFENGVTLTEDWNGDGGLTDLTFNFGALFDNPASDFKSLLPTYSVTVGRDTSYDYGDFFSQSINVSEVVDIGTEGNYTYCRDYSYYDGEENQYVDTTAQHIALPQLTGVVDSLLKQFRGDPSLGEWNVYTCWSGFLSQGLQTVAATIYYSYQIHIADFSYYTGIITFDATTFAGWVFPNPSINGLLPGITSDADFKMTFGITEAEFVDITSEPLVIHFEFWSGGLYKAELASLGRLRLIPWAQANGP